MPIEEKRTPMEWLALVRWVTCALLWAVVVTATLFPDLNLSLRAIVVLAVPAAIARTLVALSQLRKDVPRPFLLGVQWAADAVLLTGLLDITGGPFNPFIVMYATYVWLGAVALSPRWGLLVAVVSASGFGWLVLDHVQAEMAEHHRLNDFPAHLFTMWLSGTAIAELVVHYVTRAREALAYRQQLLDEARERALRSEHLASLTTLAAGAAHELSTPLATIAVAARELERAAGLLSKVLAPVSPLKDDARLIRIEVDRCRMILDGMSGRATNGAEWGAAPLPAGEIVNLVRTRLAHEHRDRLRVAIELGIATPNVSGAAVVQAVSTLLRNAFDASQPSSEVWLRFEQHASMVRIAVQDSGTGMSGEVRRRAGEPFYTTKEHGRGMGLGIFLARALAERAGGTLHFHVTDGTTAVLEFPAISELAGQPA